MPNFITIKDITGYFETILVNVNNIVKAEIDTSDNTVGLYLSDGSEVWVNETWEEILNTLEATRYI